MSRAAEMRGFRIVDFRGDIVFAAEDVLDHADLVTAHLLFEGALDPTASMNRDRPIVLVSQVPPGTTRKWAGDQSHRVFYQVDTIIMKSALERAYAPEQIIVGCADPAVPLPLVYQEYLLAFNCPVLQMKYESAEVAKCGINYMLAAQIVAANDVAAAAYVTGADYDDVERALRNDARIGPKAYLRPGHTNQHLSRDVDTVRRLAHNLPPSNSPARTGDHHGIEGDTNRLACRGK